MTFSKSKNFYLVSHITGPTHNLLIVNVIQSNKRVEPIIKSLSPDGSCGCGPPDANAVLNNVLRGAKEANDQLGTNYKVLEVRFIENDSRIETVYAYLVRKLIERIESNGAFNESKYGDDET
ncbi:MAG TPA: hypothetical protein VGB77_10920 [Abditibacteriaceae bacterium]|jgi:hypothetical protein